MKEGHKGYGMFGPGVWGKHCAGHCGHAEAPNQLIHEAAKARRENVARSAEQIFLARSHGQARGNADFNAIEPAIARIQRFKAREQKRGQ